MPRDGAPLAFEDKQQGITRPGLVACRSKREESPQPPRRARRARVPYSSSTAICSRTVPIMRCPRPFSERTARGRAIVGFANFLLRLYEAERPRAIVVAWDTLDVPTQRHEKLPGYQSGREFDEALIEQLDVLSEFVAACGFVNAKAAGYEADDFLAAAATKEQKRGGTVLVASGCEPAITRPRPVGPSERRQWLPSLPGRRLRGSRRTSPRR